MTRVVVLDFETASACDLKKSGAWRYAEDPTTDILCLGYQVDAEPAKLWIPGMDTGHLLTLADDPNTILVAHNAGFEKAIWRNIMVVVYGLPDIPNKRWHDTMAVCAMRALPLDLDHAASVLRLPQQKDTSGSAFTRAMSKFSKGGYYDRSEESLQRVYTYCLQDIATEVALVKRVGYLPVGERNVWLLDQRINERGVRLDLPFVRAARVIVAHASAPLLQEFCDLTDGLKPTQRDKFVTWIAANGFYVPDLQKGTLATLLGETDEGEEVEEWDDEGALYSEMPAKVRRALEIRQLVGSTSIKKLARMELCVGADERARGLLQYHGAGPGRWAGRLLQPQNFPQGSLSADPEALVAAIMTGEYEYVEALFGPAVEVVVSSLRHAIIAAPRRALVVGDFASIEARVVLALAGQHDKTALMAGGKDVYLDMAEDIYKAPRGSLNKKEHGALRQIGKNTVLGCGFQMGWRTFKMRYCPDQTDEFAQGVIVAYRKTWAPLVPDLWKGLEIAALETVLTGDPHEYAGVEYAIDGEWLTARLPSGRKLWYFQPEECRKQMPWSTAAAPDIRLAWRYKVKKMGQWRHVDAFGGLLTENVVQALARDLLVAAMFKCESNGIPIVLTVHDEIVGEPRTQDADPLALEQILCDSPTWARQIQLPVAAECWVGDRYKK